MQKTMTNKEYQSYVEKMTPNSKTGRNVLRAFLVGGLICVVGQFISNVLKMKGYGQEQVSSIVSLIMIFLGALLTGLNIYDDLGRYAGAGSIVPITGFANSIVSPAMEFKSEGYVMGVGARMFVIAGPVLVYGISTSIVAGIIYFLLKQ
ncbi:MAG TPA: stage V sporulation protein AC [Acetivibrio sp.]|uniref:stage V sporulation protein AC n=1 Tax=Acetivibrio sp. TaxID=1872092 RepID=UPI002CFB59D4|nr:stage V sporulation protein AC [Acetivibrio sp.]HOM01642.1 stage V sporulation protein AC [Acetivibrio sp.]